MAGGTTAGGASGGGRGGAPGADDKESAAGSEPGPPQAAHSGPQQVAQPSQPAAASSGAKGKAAAGGGAKPPQLEAKRVRQVHTAFQQYLHGQTGALQKLLDKQEFRRLMYLASSRVVVAEACQQAVKVRLQQCRARGLHRGLEQVPTCLTGALPMAYRHAGRTLWLHLTHPYSSHCSTCPRFQESDLIKLERDLLTAGHQALDFAVSAATDEQQPSMLGLAYALQLLRMLHGMPNVEARSAQRQRLADRFPPPLREQLTPDYFVPPDLEAVPRGADE